MAERPQGLRVGATSCPTLPRKEGQAPSRAGTGELGASHLPSAPKGCSPQNPQAGLPSHAGHCSEAKKVAWHFHGHPHRPSAVLN